MQLDQLNFSLGLTGGFTMLSGIIGMVGWSCAVALGVSCFWTLELCSRAFSFGFTIMLVAMMVELVLPPDP